jgi:hypothetical protein
MTEEKIPVPFRVPVTNVKAYKIVQNLRKVISTVTKNYSYDNTYIDEEQIEGKTVKFFVVVFFFYDQKDIDKVKGVIEQITKLSSLAK